jgi:hypothetical protein
MTHVVEYVPSKHEVLSSIPNIAKKKIDPSYTQEILYNYRLSLSAKLFRK